MNAGGCRFDDVRDYQCNINISPYKMLIKLKGEIMKTQT